MSVVDMIIPLLSFFGITSTFYTLFLVCDDHLVPCVEVFIKIYNVPEEIAAVTLVAFASATPEIILNTVSAVQKSTDLSMAAVLGSGMIAFGLIPPLCLLSTSNTTLSLNVFPIIRETGFYILSLLTFCYAINDGIIYTYESFQIVFIYFLYLVTVIGNYAFKIYRNKSIDNKIIENNMSEFIVSRIRDDKARQSEDEDEENYIEEASSLLPKSPSNSNIQIRQSVHNPSSSQSNDIEMGTISLIKTNSPRFSSNSINSFSNLSKLEDEDVENVGTPQSYTFYTFLMSFFAQLSLPFQRLVTMSIPQLLYKSGNAKIPLTRLFFILFACIIYMGLLTTFLVTLCQILVSYLDIGKSTIGATLVALGSEIPDVINSVALARKGYSDGALSAAVGSQVINITLAIGIPSLITCLTSIHGVFIIDIKSAKSLALLTSLLLVVIMCYLFITIPISRLFVYIRNLADRSDDIFTHSMTRREAFCLLLVWFCMYCIFVLSNESDR
jgi:Ca2+/Na+ antiporter